MKPLTDFKPDWIGLTRASEHGEGLTFACPICGPSHRLVVYFSNPIDGEPPASWQNPTWQREGDNFAIMTIAPSIQYPCFHGWIEDGQVIDVSESPLVVNMLRPDGVFGPVALSPKQLKAMTVIALAVATICDEARAALALPEAQPTRLPELCKYPNCNSVIEQGDFCFNHKGCQSAFDKHKAENTPVDTSAFANQLNDLQKEIRRLEAQPTKKENA